MTIFLFTPTIVLAEPPQQDSWTTFWSSISNWFNNLFGVSDYVTKDYTPSTTSDNSTNYNNDNKDMTSRTTPESQLTFNKGVYLKKILDNTYTNKTIPAQDICPEIKLSDIVYYYYTTGQKILYDPNDSKKPIEYDSRLMEKFKVTLSKNSSCYINLYNNLQDVPQGDYQGKANAAAISSKQLNNSLRTPISISNQGDDIPSDNLSTVSAEIIVKDNDKQEKTMLMGFIPNQGQSSLNTDDRSSLRDNFGQWMQPDDWKSEPPERTDSDLESGDWEIGGHCRSDRNQVCKAEGSHCRGMSQYGALGMAEAGKGYEEILKFYYGNVAIKTIDSQNMLVKVSIDDEDVCPSGSSINVEEYLRGLGEMPNYWGNQKTGGYEAMKAQVVAARTYAYVRTNKFANPICNTSNCQVFHCNDIDSKPNLTRAVKETTGQILVDASNETVFLTEYARSFCGFSRAVTCTNHTNPSVNGYEYELKANHGQPKSCK